MTGSIKGLFCVFLAVIAQCAMAQPQHLQDYNPVWTTPSSNSAASMPCGGGDIGMNIWVEKGDLLFYISRSGTFDENNSLLKLGRVRIHLSPNPFEGSEFRQELVLRDGELKISAKKGTLTTNISMRADVFHPLIEVKIESSQPLDAAIGYESWRTADRQLQGKENNQNSWKWAPQGVVKTYKDDIQFDKNSVLFYHRNQEHTVFDATVKQQGLEEIKNQLTNPLKGLTFGGRMTGIGLTPSGKYSGVYQNSAFEGWRLSTSRPSRKIEVSLILHTDQTANFSDWQRGLMEQVERVRRTQKTAAAKSRKWWNKYWDNSFIIIENEKDSPEWQAGRNYQLFRYLLGCNAFGQSPTKFNGGLFTYDPVHTDSTLHYSPDFRNWGGGTHTAQNQRLVYWPMLKSGDAELMKAQFNYYQQALHNATLRTKFYWHHEGASFTEQLENFGLPNPAEYGWKRPENYDKGMEYNGWLEYEWDTALEFCMMMLETERYAGKNIDEYLPLIESCLTFFNAHYQFLAKQRGSKALNDQGHLILYPGSGAETYKMAYNSTSTIAGLKTVLKRLLELPLTSMPVKLSTEKRAYWTAMLSRIPPISFRESGGHPTLAPAMSWERINNTESPQLYPVFPWGIYGIGKSGLDTARNTYLYDQDVIRFRSHAGWKQDNIFAARLGLTEEAERLTLLKMKDSGRRFPAFWGPGFDWVPDHNWGGSGMIGMQEMLMQVDGKKIILFPAWPKKWNTHFKLHAPYQTTIEGSLKNGKLEFLKVIPESRRKDVVVL